MAARFRIENTTDERITDVVQLFVNGVVHVSFDIDIQGNASKTLRTPRRQPIVRAEAGLYAVQIGNLVQLFNIRPAEISLANLSSLPRSAGRGGTVEIAVDVFNDGGVAGPYSVNLGVDEDEDIHTGTLLPGGEVTLFRGVDIVPPFLGPAGPGFHDVEADGEKDFYEVGADLIDTAVATTHPCDPDKARAADADGNPLPISANCVLDLGAGSITLTLPVRAPLGVRVGSFVDPGTGISVRLRDVVVPVKDPATGETLLTLRGRLESVLVGTAAGDEVTGRFEFLDLVAEERRRDLSADDPDVGALGVSFRARLTELPEGVSLLETIKKELSRDGRTVAELEARKEGKIIGNEAGVVTVLTPGLDSKTNVEEVEITLKVSARWIDRFGVENVRIAHIDDEGNVEMLVPVCEGPDDKDEYTCVGVTERGFSEFSLLALVDIPSGFSAENLVVTPDTVEPGESVKITIDIFNEGGREGSFSTILKLKKREATEFSPIAVKSINLAAGEDGKIRFFVTQEEQARYDVQVEGRKGEILEGSFDVFRKITQADLSLANFVITPAEVGPGETVRISGDVLNAGNEDGSTEIQLRINGVLFQTQRLVVPGRGSSEPQSL